MQYVDIVWELCISCGNYLYMNICVNVDFLKEK